MNILVSATFIILANMPFPCKICSEPWKFFQTSDADFNQSYFANILTTLDEKPLPIRNKNFIVRLTTAPAFDSPNTKIIVFKNSNISVISKTLKFISKNTLPSVITKSKVLERTDYSSKMFEQEIDSIIRDMKAEKCETKSNPAEMENDAKYFLLEIADSKSKEYLFKISKDYDKKWYPRILKLFEII